MDSDLRQSANDPAQAERRLLEIFRICPAALSISRWDNKKFVDVNAAFSRLLGWTRAEMVGRTTADLNVADTDALLALSARLERDQTVRDVELTIRTRNGEARNVLVGLELFAMRGETLVISSFVDITTRKRAELAATRLAAIVESSDDAIVGEDLNGVITSWNRGAETTFGYLAVEMVGGSIAPILPPGREVEETQMLGAIARGEVHDRLETVRRTKDDRFIDVSITASPIRDSDGVVVGMSTIARDITEHKRIEETRRMSEARYRALFDYAPDGILIADDDSYYVDANASVCRMLGYSHDELVGLHASDIVVPTEMPHIGPALRAITTRGDYHREWKFRRKDGSGFTAEVIGAMMPDGNLLGLIRDTTERNKREGRFRRLVESNAQGVMFWNVKGSVSAANDALLRIIGRTREDLDMGRVNWVSMTPPEYAAADQRALDEIALGGVCTPYEKEYVRGDGSRVPVLLGAASFDDDLSEGVSFVLDLTERKKLEQQFFRAQRMESIGTLAGGIAHDLNNVLAPILLSVGLLKASTKDAQLSALIDTIHGCAQRGAELVQQVLSFARGVEGRRVLVNPRHILQDLLKVLRDTFPRSIDLDLEATPDVWNIQADPTQIHQVFMNLSINARDAMSDGGSLLLKMDNVVLDETYAAMNIDARPGAYVRITVADTGAGIPPEARDRIFEPFFTTKEVGKGTGLGLSTALAIVKSHGGFIHVYSEVDQGTKFKVYLPASTTAIAANDVAVGQTRLPRGDGQLIMIVDDEAAIRDIAKATLERFGYRVMLAANGAEAVALFAVHRAEIAVVLTDMAMPVMDGPSTIIALKSIDRSVKIVGSSGLASNDGVAKAVGAGVQHFVPKPYTAETLLTTLQGILGSPPISD
jgi:PAS domain S-box-containing protein